jgi:hypothetical protein
MKEYFLFAAKIQAMVLLLIALTQCASFHLPSLNLQSTVALNALQAAEGAYGTVLAAENVYKQLPLCHADNSVPPPCAKRSVIVRLQSADRQALSAVRAAIAFVNKYPTVDATNVIGAVNQALANIQSILNGATS